MAWEYTQRIIVNVLLASVTIKSFTHSTSFFSVAAIALISSTSTLSFLVFNWKKNRKKCKIADREREKFSLVYAWQAMRS
jgi:hypothetical protein